MSNRLSSVLNFNDAQKHYLELMHKDINSIFAKYLEADILNVLNFNVINFYLKDLEDLGDKIKINTDSSKVERFYYEVIEVLEKINKELNAKFSANMVDKKIDYLDESIKSVNELKEKIKNKDTHDIYESAANENQTRADNSRMAFIVLIILSIVMVWFCSVTKTYFGLKDYDYWFFKGTLILTSVTLITYFLKQSVKYQKIADQCRQTKMELEAFPSFVASFTTEDPQIIEIRKELALKYFGRELDNKTNDETSNILQDQMKNTTEMVKTAMEVLKKTGNS
ncbi:hypothetical protein NRA02_17815 [Acinetobacter baumannii]|uniref:hypothetical protein n=1 Tax=Acinetobacter baumannii TaxID=470 RepID=UPI00233F35E0|nr:hypothetical protein [Acinetobacter baumannii]MDC5033808.1 hypothetical protein [Acinetobacter baumannii]MDC5377204.1 hypothetical protein [Acinetobacter baumannii]MDV7602479.1 hypothetical protein [Acinetobacter baumannii]MDX7903899.1 hypothetical protein [Acinetobacter baumannii]